VKVVNDDGPPSVALSPYIAVFLEALQDAGHTVSVVLPDQSRSWIGKAHIINDTLRATYVRAESFVPGWKYPDQEWILIDGTPASCTQLALYNLLDLHEKVDLVISGPNHGRNASSIYNLSSGTVGGAMEAALCGKKAIALSFASKERQPEPIIRSASRLAVKLAEHLMQQWPDNVELFNVNIPMRADIEERPLVYTSPQRNYWSKGSLYKELRQAEPKLSSKSRLFAWKPELTDIERSVEQSAVGTDMWATKEGYVR
jgi:5'/3'-nucleotidase SurE